LNPQPKNPPPGDWTPARVDASTRRYYRGQLDGAPALLADFGEDADGLERFVHVQGLLGAGGLAVPEILLQGGAGGWLVLSWVPGKLLSKVKWREVFEDRLLDVASAIARVDGWGSGPPALLELDGARMAFELAFFRVHCLEGFLNMGVPDGLGKALDALAEEAAAFPRVLAHRDLHSENVLWRGGERFVLTDFQDALLAPRCYDAASLAVDAYRDQHPAIRARFEEKWTRLAGCPRAEFGATALQRALKALGTFGFQVARRKRARYLSFMAPGAAHALAYLSFAPASLETLRPVLDGLAAAR
jgi:N-acetylmuramate 1-kinase